MPDVLSGLDGRALGEFDDLDLESLQELLIEMVDDGHLFARCPGCTLPLSAGELTSGVCQCGPFDANRVLYGAAEVKGNA